LLIIVDSLAYVLIFISLQNFMAKTSERDDIRRHQEAHKVESWALAHHPTIPGLCVSGDERGVAMAAGLVGGWLAGEV
jgi:HAMP domain-containing protein